MDSVIFLEASFHLMILFEVSIMVYWLCNQLLLKGPPVAGQKLIFCLIELADNEYQCEKLICSN